MVKPGGVSGLIVAAPAPPPGVTQIWRRRNPEVVEHVISLLAAGKLIWYVSKSYPLEEASAAYEAILGRHVRGKSVLVF